MPPQSHTAYMGTASALSAPSDSDSSLSALSGGNSGHSQHWYHHMQLYSLTLEDQNMAFYLSKYQEIMFALCEL